MYYLEQLKFGDCFEYKNEKFILTQDFDNNNKYKCVCLKGGNVRWFESNSMINQIEIYTLDNENNICAIKQRDKETS